MPDDPIVAADIEITEPGTPGTGVPLVMPETVRINGTKLWCPADSPIQIHGIDLRDRDVVRVTITLFARRVRVGWRDELHLSTEEMADAG